MKSLILFSSLFYILGLKIGHKIDLFKNYNPVEKITSTTNAVKSASKVFYFGDEPSDKSKADSVKIEDAVKKEPEQIGK